MAATAQVLSWCGRIGMGSASSRYCGAAAQQTKRDLQHMAPAPAHARGMPVCLAFARDSWCRTNNSRAGAFEPLQAGPNGFRVHLLSRSDALSLQLETTLEGNGQLYPYEHLPGHTRSPQPPCCWRCCCPTTGWGLALARRRRMGAGGCAYIRADAHMGTIGHNLLKWFPASKTTRPSG